MARFTVRGVKGIDRAFAELPKRIANKVIRKALREACKPIKEEAKSKAPRGKTLKLVKAIKVRAGKRKKGAIRVNVAVGQGDFKGKTFYGAFQEYGTARIKTPAEFMKKAFRGKGHTAKEIAEAEILAGVDREKRALKS